MRGLIKNWGNSAAVRIPTSVLAAANLRLEQAVDVREEDGRVIIEPVRPAPYSLADLLAGVTAYNIHDPIDTRSPMGNEIW